MPDSLPTTGVVVIGRNEGERLRRCLESLKSSNEAIPVVYVDSNSTDGSVELALSLGATIVSLDLTKKFTAARARNAGLAQLLEGSPEVEFVQFVDGDCELCEGWLEQAREHLSQNSELAAVCGRRRERFPNYSVYNRLCDLEWDTPIGNAKSCGGDSLMRGSVLKEVGPFREDLIAGEEPELCFRMRQAGYRIERLDLDMTWHDANLSRPSQWFKRSQRAGHAFAESAALHGSHPERPGVRQTASNLVWGLGVPAALGLGAVAVSPLLAGLGGAGAYSYLYLKSYRWEKNRRTPNDAKLFAASCVAAKLPEALGALTFLKNRALRRQSQLIEYKGPADTDRNNKDAR